MDQLSFLYRKPDGEEKSVKLTNWRESGRYLIGVCIESHAPRTYRKDRVVSYFDGSDALLGQPFSDPPPPVRHAPEILFTGFASAARSALEGFAAGAGMKVVKTVTQGLTYLCVGANAGPSKVEKARGQGVWILTSPQLANLVETGELPDEEPEFL